jgi:hypothetical protein
MNHARDGRRTGRPPHDPRRHRGSWKEAYAAFVHASIRYRNAAGDDERRKLRDERWSALAEILLVARPEVVRAAAYMVSTGERLLTGTLTPEERAATFRAMWDNNVRFTRLARSDLGVGAPDPFEGVRAVVGEAAVVFERPPDGGGGT